MGKTTKTSEGAKGKIISKAVLRDKILGCWLGKNAGGTLGSPFEAGYGREEVFNIKWYTELPEEGIPNDDLELQLIWLQALQECGPGLTARDLTEYWLDCVEYNFDEYGLGKENMKKGLEPPLCGWHNNWFKDCMGSPIRSEIWACITPGVPNAAAYYAYEDAVCDHAGGESVYGEIFNAVFESCAFFEDDKIRLIELGLKAIPNNSRTYKAIREAVELYQNGSTWKAARDRIKKLFYSPIAQYSPINLGFQTIGLLYGSDFGDVICTAVNCGWDTDCTAATAGAMVGIIDGASNLPEKWLEPLGRTISTNIITGGIRNLRAPTNIDELTDQVMRMAERSLRYWGADVQITDVPDDAAVIQRSSYTINTVPEQAANLRTWKRHAVDVSLAYIDGAAILGDRPNRVRMDVHNPHPDTLNVLIAIIPPEGWHAEFAETEKASTTVHINPGTTSSMEIFFSASPAEIHESNTGIIQISVPGRPAVEPIPVSLLGGYRWLVSPLFTGRKIEDDCGIDEKRPMTEPMKQLPKGWTDMWRSENDLKAESLFQGEPGVLYFRHLVFSHDKEDTIIGVSNNGCMKLWLNGEFLHKTRTPVHVRPSQGVAGGDGSNYTECTLQPGWNEVLIKLERGVKPMDAHFVLAGFDKEHPINIGHALIGLNRSSLPWE